MINRSAARWAGSEILPLSPLESAGARSIAELVEHHVEFEINRGILLPGDALEERELADNLAVPRAAARDALLALLRRGMVTIVPCAGVYVSRPSIPELLSLVELLAELEGSCAKLATRRISADALVALKRIEAESEKVDEAGDVQTYSHANAQFHEVLYRACGNNSLVGEIARVRRRTQVFRHTVFQNRMRIGQSREDHAGVVTAMLYGDAMRASKLMIDHILVGGRMLADLVDGSSVALLPSAADYPGRSTAESERAILTSRSAEQAEPLPDERSVTQRVRRHLRGDESRVPSLAEVAGGLHLSARTLTRKLAQEGASFQKIKDDLRRDLAIQRIANSEEPVAQIAHDLGFGDSSAFYRAFRSWTGLTPRSYRAGTGRK